MTSTNLYLKNKNGTPGTPEAPSVPLLERVGVYVTDLLHIFGAIEGPKGGIGFPISQNANFNVCFCIDFHLIYIYDVIV